MEIDDGEGRNGEDGDGDGNSDRNKEDGNKYDRNSGEVTAIAKDLLILLVVIGRRVVRRLGRDRCTCATEARVTVAAENGRG